MLFCKKWLKNHPKFLLHFLIHIDVLMLCRKFELILSRNPPGVLCILSRFEKRFLALKWAIETLSQNDGVHSHCLLHLQGESNNQ